MFFRKKLEVPKASEALPGRDTALATAAAHFVNGRSLAGPFEARFAQVQFGMGCFWGAERKFWQIPRGIHVTAVGYSGGATPNPTYEEVCSGMTGHTETVLVVFDPAELEFANLIKVFWESHDPTQGMRQGNDVGTQYRSALYVSDPALLAKAKASRQAFQLALTQRGFGQITTEIGPEPPFYYAEAYHQQYLAKNPAGYCGLGGTGVSCPVGIAIPA